MTGFLFFRPDCCPYCQSCHLHFHGGYPRKPDRGFNSVDNHNPVKIFRFRCSDCKRTCSVLPECIPPARWYMWQIQQAAIFAYLTEQSLRAIAKTMMPSRQTIKRWWLRLKEQYTTHRSVLVTYLSALGRTTTINEFWQCWLNEVYLSTAMRLLHGDGFTIP